MGKIDTKLSPQQMANLRSDGMTLQEIADELGTDYNDVRNTLYRALYKLRMGTVARQEKAEDFYETLRSQLEHLEG